MGGGGVNPRTTLTTAVDALRDEEIERTRTFLRTGWVVALGAAPLVLAVPGDRRIATALLALIGLGVVASLWLYRQLHDTRFDARRLRVLAIICVLCGQLGVLYCGTFSAAMLITVLGLYFFCRTENTADAIAIYAAAAGAHAVEATLVISGAIEDPGFYPVRTSVSPLAQIAGHLVLQLGYLLGFVMARLGRKASLRSIGQLQEATRLAAQREEQVNELRQDLDRALKIGGPGRFTGHTVGTWELGNVIGRGAMGEVYDATHTATREPAAVKLLRRELLGARDYVERFLREVRAASSLDSPHAVRVLAASTPEDPIPFLAMERLRGQSLGDLLRATGTLDRERLGELVVQVGSVLERARAAGIVHRDLKPHNLFLTEDGTWKVLDFGVAHLGEHTGTLTHGAVVGTPGYMAPEQARGEPVDHRADLYALGAVIYRCLTGVVPFSSRDTPALLYAVVHQMPIRPSALGAVTSQVEAFLAVALAKSRDARFQTAADLVSAYTDADLGGMSSELRLRARAQLRQSPWQQPENAETKQLPDLARRR
jgi:serine/threonine-protein kinase